MELDQDRDGVEAAGRYGKQLKLAGVPTKVELIRTLSGHGARLIVATARDHEAGMIVLGSRGRRGPDRTPARQRGRQGHPSGRPSCLVVR